MLTRIQCAEHLRRLLVRIDWHDGKTVEDDEFALTVREFAEGDLDKIVVSVASRRDTPISALDGLMGVYESVGRFSGWRYLSFVDGEASCNVIRSGEYAVSVEDETTGEQLVAPGPL